MSTEQDLQRAKEQARAQLDGIVSMAKRLKHCDECDGSDPEQCGLTDQELADGLDEYWEGGAVLDDEEREDYRTRYHDKEQASESIDEDPLSVEVRGGWHTPGEDNEMVEYTILLCTGGPACRIIGDLSEHNEPDSARLEYQDWFTPWTKFFDFKDDEEDLLLTYAQHFYYGE